jgi:hypothetical protein
MVIHIRSRPAEPVRRIPKGGPLAILLEVEVGYALKP